MKVIVLLLGVVGLALGEAPYAPSGWRPAGPQLQLPTQIQQPRNLQQPNTQYGAPSNQYLPQRETTNIQSQNRFNSNPRDLEQLKPPTNQYGAPSNQYSIPNTQYSAPNTQYSAPNNQYSAPSNQYSAPNNQYGAPNRQYSAPNSQNQYSTIIQPSISSELNTYGAPQTQANRPTNSYGAPNNNNQNNVANQYGAPNKVEQGLPIYETPTFRNAEDSYQNVNNQYGAPNNDANNVNLKRQPLDQEDFEDGGSGFGPNQDPNTSYGAPSTSRPDTREFQTTTPRQENTTPVEDEDDDEESTEGPNVSVATAVANAGQYYILQPDGRLQRVVYKTERNEEDRKKGNTFSARLVYEDVEPIKGPIYTYGNDPLGQLVQINK